MILYSITGVPCPMLSPITYNQISVTLTERERSVNEESRRKWFYSQS